MTPPAKVNGSVDLGLDDIGNASRFVHQHAENARYVPELDSWLTWDGNRWTNDTGSQQAMERAKATVRTLKDEAEQAPNDDYEKKIRQHANASGRSNRIRGLLDLARTDPAISRPAAGLDRDPWLLCTPSGTIDLHNGKLRLNDRVNGITLQSRAAFVHDAKAPLWDATLARSLPDEETRNYLQRLVGVSLIGQVVEHVLPIPWGAGANGKSTILEAIRQVLGEYATSAPLDLLMQVRRDGGAATPELAALRAKRFVLVSETREDARLAAERVKSITGGDAITARPLYGHPITFQPSHTVWLQTNHRPRVGDDGEAIWRRLALIPFNVVIPEPERDGRLPSRLELEASGILKWCVDGCLAYQRDGLSPPATIKDATREYRDAEDTFGAFLADRTTEDLYAFVAASDLHVAYGNWAHVHQGPRLSSTAMAERLRAKGYEAKKAAKGKRVWQGLRLIGEDR